MSLPISSWSIRRPLLPFLFFLGLLIAGSMAYLKMPVNNMPNVRIPIVNIAIVFPGASPKDMESQITNRIEDAVASVGNIKHISSSVTDGVSSTQIEFNLGTDINSALSSVRDQMIQVRPLLPRGAEEPVVQRIDADVVPILTYTINSPKRSLEDTSWFVDEKVIHALLAIKGVAKIQRQGGLNQEIMLELDPARLQAYGITAGYINNQLRDTALTAPAGRIDDNSREILIRAAGSPSDLESLAQISLALPDGGFVRLKDLGELHNSASKPRQFARLNHQPVVAFAVYRSSAASEVSIESGVQSALNQLKQENPDIEFTLIQSRVDFAKESYRASLWSFLEGALLASLIVFLFLRSWSATWIALLVIPLSVIPTFLIIHWLGFSLNIVSMLALSLVSGILVDDAIVEIENIMRHIRMGKTPYQAALDAADQIGLAVVATTMVIVAMFLPVSFMGGVIGQYFIQFGLTVAISTLFSLFVARLITPVLCAYFLRPKAIEPHAPNWVRRYLIILQAALKYRKTMLLMGLCILGCSALIITYLPTGFKPAEDKSQSTLDIELPPGTKLTDTDSKALEITDKLLQQPEVQYVYSLIGAADSDTNIEGEVRRATLSIQLKPREERSIDTQTFQEQVLKPLGDIPNVRMGFLDENGSKEVSFSIASNDAALLQKAGTAIEKDLHSMHELSNVSSTLPISKTELIITPRFDEAARMGVSSEAIAETIRLSTIGDLNANLTRMTLGNRKIPIRVLLNKSSNTDINSIATLPVATNQGRTVPLASVADVSLGAGPANIEHYNYQRQITFEANLNGVTLGQALQSINQLPSIKQLPDGVTRYDTGDAELLTEMFESFSMSMIGGILVVFGVLALLFRSIFQPLTIMTALPLSIGGALLALLLTGASLSLPSVIGILMLMGIVGKNGILLVDFIVESRQAGMARHAAIVEACKQRARPIVMTTLAMIAGMLPIIMGLVAGKAFRTPMAISVIGGLVTSTALSLLFVPVIYIYMDDFQNWLVPKLKHLILR